MKMSGDDWHWFKAHTDFACRCRPAIKAEAVDLWEHGALNPKIMADAPFVCCPMS